jgi:hypothetical protein
MEDIKHMNFGSVQLYVGTVVKPDPEPETRTTDEQVVQPETTDEL